MPGAGAGRVETGISIRKGNTVGRAIIKSDVGKSRDRDSALFLFRDSFLRRLSADALARLFIPRHAREKFIASSRGKGVAACGRKERLGGGYAASLRNFRTRSQVFSS